MEFRDGDLVYLNRKPTSEEDEAGHWRDSMKPLIGKHFWVDTTWYNYVVVSKNGLGMEPYYLPKACITNNYYNLTIDVIRDVSKEEITPYKYSHRHMIYGFMDHKSNRAMYHANLYCCGVAEIGNFLMCSNAEDMSKVINAALEYAKKDKKGIARATLQHREMTDPKAEALKMSGFVMTKKFYNPNSTHTVSEWENRTFNGDNCRG